MIEEIVQEIMNVEARVKDITSKNDEMISRRVIVQTEVVDKFLEILDFPEEAENEFLGRYSNYWRGVDSLLRNTNKTLSVKVKGILTPLRQILESIPPKAEKYSIEIVCERVRQVIEKVEKEASEIQKIGHENWKISSLIQKKN